MLQRTLLSGLVAGWLASSAFSQPPFPAQRVTPSSERLPFQPFLTRLSQQSGIVIECDSKEADKPVPISIAEQSFWEVLDQAADATGHRLIPIKKGTALRMVRATGPTVAPSRDGPFRFAVRQVIARTDFDLGQTSYDLALDLHWEPRYPVFRIESDPTLNKAESSSGEKLSFTPNRTKVPISSALYQPVIRLSGVSRSAKTVTVSGQYVVTAAEKMLSIPFPLATVPASKAIEGITARLTRVEKVDDRIEIELELDYPKDQPEFESFESFVTRNQAVLRSGPTSWEPSDFELSSQGRRVVTVYRFMAKPGEKLIWEPKNWQLEYRTPSPLKEFPVRFHFAAIPLP